VPSWVWVWCGLAQFIGYTLDGTDGIQARKTKSSSPLGRCMVDGVVDDDDDDVVDMCR
jgi:phosphatidylglycerophosphate synthase